MDKTHLRQDMQNTIKQISAADRAKENKIIFDIRYQELLTKYKNRAVYISLPSEVDTTNIIKTLISHNKKCLLPIKPEANFFFTEIGPDTEYNRRPNGVGEPIVQTKTTQVPDVILVPGLAFTRTGARLGRGLGRYDQLLVQYPKIAKIGVCFQSQIIKNIPTQAHDQDMDMILSTKLYFRS